MAMMQTANFSLISLGCARTLVDSEKMIDDLQNGGFRLVAPGSREPITILNTCSFIQAAIEETEENISKLSEKKQRGKLKYLVVTGCYPSRFKQKELEEKFPDVDLWLTTKQEDQVKQKLSDMVFSNRFLTQKKVPYTKLTPTHYAYLKISEGCNNWCSFCTIPKIRGEHTSKPIDIVVAEAKKQLSFGARELILIAEDTTCWGEDIYGKPSLPILLKELAKLPVEWIRIMYVFPSRVDEEFIQCVKSTPNIIPYIDMPVQHVNSELLSQMRRQHDRPFLEGILEKFNSEIPHVALRTTFIVGFPGETESQVDEIIEVMDKFPFAQVGCFSYSEERETRSARYEPKIDGGTIQRRMDRIMKRQWEIVQKENKKRIGKIERLLYEGNGIGRTYREAPDVDGVIIVENSSHLLSGEFYDVKITGIKDYDLKAVATEGK